ncbi:MAG: DUF1631 family protein [Pseudomonadales bacterium]|nr:DUF1631 family protein [Pseudomonadales bacterium]
MERRSSPRRPIHLNATLCWRNKTSWACTIEDFCAEGLFLKYSSDIADRLHFIEQRQSDFEFNVDFSVSGQSFSLLVKPVRVIDGAMGVMFLESNPNAFSAMLRACSGIADQANVSSNSSKAKFIVRQCSKAILAHIGPLLDEFFSAVDQGLKASANSAASNQLGNEIMDAAMHVANRKKNAIEEVLQRVSSPLRQHGIADSANGHGEDHLSLVDKSEFEDWLTVKVMITKAETLYRGPLLELKMRLDNVGIVNDTGYQNPLGPALICYAFKKASDQLDLPKPAEKTYFRTFEYEVLRKLEPLYQELNQIMIRQGILPDLDLSKYLLNRKSKPADIEKAVKEEAKRLASAQVSAQRVSADEVSAGKTYGSDKFSGADQKLSAEELHQSENMGASLASVNAIKPTPTDKTESGTDSAAATGARAYPWMNKKVPELSREDAERALTPPFMAADYREVVANYKAHANEAEQVFKTVQNLFSVLEKTRHGTLSSQQSTVRQLQDVPKWSPDELNQSLQRLQQLSVGTSVLPDGDDLSAKVREVLKEEHPVEKAFSPQQEETLDVVDRFFESLRDNHKLTEQAKLQIKQLQIPVLRALLQDKKFFEDKNSPVRVVINRIGQLGVKGGRPSPAHQQKIEQLIDRINREYEQDNSVFDEVVADLDEMVERQNLLYRRNVERVMAAAEGAQKVELAKKIVNKEIEKRIAGRKVPKAIISLINGGWRDLLSLVYIRQGGESQTWQDYLSVLDTLLSYGDNPHMDLNLPELLKLIQEGLASISSSHIPSGHIRDELKRFIVGSREHAPEVIEIPESREESEAADVTMVAENRHKNLNRWISRAQNLRPGDWLKSLQNPETPQHMRLVWVGHNFSRFVFVNHQGMKVVELNLNQLAAQLQKALMVLDPDYEVPIVDESLDNMVKQVYEQLSFATTHDEITGLANRKEVERTVENLLIQQAEGEECTLIHIDLRQFKIINDTAGYDAGDQLLKEVADILKAYAPPGAILARLGGNEFAVVVTRQNVEMIARQFIKAIHEHVFSWDGSEYSISVSVGVASTNQFVTNTEKLMSAAESACRNSKKLGQNRLYTYSFDETNLSQQEQIVAKVAGFKDLDKERILLRCQKIIPLQSSASLGTQHEILLSIYDDKGHLIPATEFVRTAEHYNRMQAVDRWVVGHMLDWMDNNPAALKSMGQVCINLSGNSLNDEELLEFVFDRLSERNSPMEKVCFEITEAAAISNISDVVDFMNELKETGCQFCLGNFGAGMSSYHYLKSLPVDRIKIDGSFIKDLAKTESDQAMVRSMTEMVHFMGKEVIASQVEDRQSLELLTAMGVDYAQGYCIEKPRLITSF